MTLRSFSVLIYKQMKKIDRKILVLVGIFVVALFVFALITWRGNKMMDGVISPDVASSRAIDFISERLGPGAAINLTGVVKESSVYKITVQVNGEQFDVFTTLDGKFFFAEAINLEDRVVYERTVGGFMETEDELCLEDGKPIIYYFGVSECPFCVWQRPVIVEAMKQFEGYASFRDHTDTENDREVFFRYSDGSVPLIVAGCRYFRVGAGGREGDEESDKDAISAVTCKLTGGQPREVCHRLEEIIN